MGRVIRAVARVTAMLALAAVILSACGHDTTTDGTSAESRIAAHPDDGEEGDTSYVRGTLKLDGGCLSLIETQQETAGRRWVHALPAGTARIEENELLYRGHRYPLGSEVQVDGSPAANPDSHTVPPDCDDDVPLWTGWGESLDAPRR